MALKNKFVGDAPGVLTATSDTGILFAAGNTSSVSESIAPIHRTVITVPTFSFTTTSAAKSVGQLVYTFPAGRIIVFGAMISTTLTTGAATSSTAGEIGLGSVIGSGANATLGAVGATSEDIMEGTTIANCVASTANAITKGNHSIVGADHGATAVWPLNGTSTNVPVYFNLATTFAGTAGCTVSGTTISLLWSNLGDQ